MGLQSWQSGASRRTLLSAYSPDAAALGLIIVFLGFRLVLAATLGLGVDESYAIANARELELSYFDHPPLHYWIAHAFMPLVGDGRALRLPFIILFAGSSWLLYRLTRRLFGDWAGVWAVLALNLSAFFTLSAGGWIVPDGPLIFFLLAAALTLANAFFPAAAPASPWRSWILAGIYLGLASLAKYQAVLFGFGLLLYLVSVPGRRRVLLHPAPWAGALIALAIFSPVLIWNAQHGWVSFAYQGGRGLATRRASRRQCACQRRRPGGLDPALDLRAAGDCGLAGLAGRTSAGTILVLPLPRPADDRVLHRHSALGRQRSAALADVRLADALSDPWRLSRRPCRRASGPRRAVGRSPPRRYWSCWRRSPSATRRLATASCCFLPPSPMATRRSRRSRGRRSGLNSRRAAISTATTCSSLRRTGWMPAGSTRRWTARCRSPCSAT